MGMTVGTRIRIDPVADTRTCRCVKSTYTSFPRSTRTLAISFRLARSSSIQRDEVAGVVRY
jgi:hypothetical protein